MKSIYLRSIFESYLLSQIQSFILFMMRFVNSEYLFNTIIVLFFCSQFIMQSFALLSNLHVYICKFFWNISVSSLDHIVFFKYFLKTSFRQKKFYSIYFCLVETFSLLIHHYYKNLILLDPFHMKKTMIQGSQIQIVKNLLGRSIPLKVKENNKLFPAMKTGLPQTLVKICLKLRNAPAETSV